MRISDWSSDVCSSDLVVRTHRDQVDADPVVLARFDREFQLGADAVVRRNEQGVVEPRRLQVEETAKTAQVGVGTGTARRTGERSDGTDQRVAGPLRYAGLGISEVRGWVGVGVDGQRGNVHWHRDA